MSLAVGRIEDRAGREQIIQQRLDLACKAAGIAAQVDAKRDDILLEQRLDGVDRLLCAAGFKVVDLDIARVGLFLAVVDRALVRPLAVDGQR